MSDVRPTATCGWVVERLPWLLNASLAEAERVATLRHLRHCSACRTELVELGEIWRLLSDHPSVSELVELGMGTASSEVVAEVEAHVAICNTCRDELLLVRSDTEEVVLDELMRRPHSASRILPWRARARISIHHFGRLAAAATLVAVCAWWLRGGWTGPEAPGPASRSGRSNVASLAVPTEEPPSVPARSGTGVIFFSDFESGSAVEWDDMRFSQPSLPPEGE